MKTIPLTQGYAALVDDKDFEQLSKFTWYVAKGRKTFYAERHLRSSEHPNQKKIKMHHQILKCAPDDRPDHIDGNGLNNRRSNLRIATNAQNLWNRGAQRNNSTGFKGVCFDRTSRSTNKFKAVIKKNGVQKHLGRFETPEAAHAAYCAAAIRQHKEFARLK